MMMTVVRLDQVSRARLSPHRPAVPGSPGAALVLLVLAVQPDRFLSGGQILHGQDHRVLGSVGAEVAG